MRAQLDRNDGGIYPRTSALRTPELAGDRYPRDELTNDPHITRPIELQVATHGTSHLPWQHRHRAKRMLHWLYIRQDPGLPFFIRSIKRDKRGAGRKLCGDYAGEGCGLSH